MHFSWNAPKSNILIFGSFLVFKSITCFFLEMPHFFMFEIPEMPPGHFSRFQNQVGISGKMHIPPRAKYILNIIFGVFQVTVFSMNILAADNEEEENVEPALEPKWKFDRITSITIDEPIATWFHMNKYLYKKCIQFLQSFYRLFYLVNKLLIIFSS